MLQQTLNKEDGQTDTIKTTKDNSKLTKLMLIIAGVLFSIMLVLYFVLSIYYNKHFYNNTMINSINVSNMTADHAENAIDSGTKSYILNIKGKNDLTDQIAGTDIHLHTVIEGGIDELLKKHGGFGWPSSLFSSKKYTIKAMTSYDKSSLQSRFDRLKFFEKSNIKQPTDAHISEYSEKGYSIIPENSGTSVKKGKLYKQVEKAINSLTGNLSIEAAGCYESAKIDAQSSKLKEALDKMNKMVQTKITYHFGDVTEVLDGSKISKWLSVDDEGKVHLDENGVKEYVDYIGKTYNTFGKVRTFKTSYGKTIKVKGGHYGWWLNRPSEKADLIDLIKDGKQLTRKPVYFQEAQQYGKDDIGNTYVEINLNAQHLFFYKNGSLFLDTDIVSGDVMTGRETPTGTYPVQYKESNATLQGENYSTPVKYWMPFNGNIGLHDANWRHGLFGGNHYLDDGSHGCINMPPDMAKRVFKNIKKGIAVIVYKLD